METATEIKERPILFTGPMVRAILEGRKTQTRRVAKLTDGGHVRLGKKRWHPGDENAVEACRYGQPGDRLWVRETWTPCSSSNSGFAVTFKDGSQKYRDGTYWSSDGFKYKEDAFDHIKWKPSIHMPRWASRITLEVTGVRVQRLKEISEGDAAAEGCDIDWYGDTGSRNPEEGSWPCPRCKGTLLYEAGSMDGVTEADCLECDTAARMFRHLWDSINAKRGFGWDANPWVWVVEFGKCEPEKK